MKKYILLFLLGGIFLGACKKIDLTNGFILPTGEIKGKLVWNGTDSPAADYYIIFTNEDNGATDMSFSFENGDFNINRMAAGNYSMTVFNDSVIFSNDTSFKLEDGEVKQLGSTGVEVAPYPELTLNLQAINSTSVDVKVDVNENGNCIRARGVRYLLASDTLDISSGTKKTVSWPPQLEFWEQSVTSLLPDTEYRMSAYVYIYRGFKADGTSNKTIVVYSDEKTFKTAAE